MTIHNSHNQSLPPISLPKLSIPNSSRESTPLSGVFQLSRTLAYYPNLTEKQIANLIEPRGRIVR